MYESRGWIGTAEDSDDDNKVPWKPNTQKGQINNRYRIINNNNLNENNTKIEPNKKACDINSKELK